jgi:hypothetical protein
MAIASFLDLCLDATSAARVEPFWAAVLGYDLVRQRDGSAYLTVPGSAVKVYVNEVPEPKTVKNRVHLDVHCSDVADLLALGATVLRPPSETAHWWLLASPEGDEFCAFVREEVPANRLYEIVVDAADAAAQATWWGDLLGVSPGTTDDGAYLQDVPGLPAEYLVFQTVPEPKIIKNRVHWDVRANVDDVLARGATLLRGPAPDGNWHIAADPEGNEFCVFPV